MMEILRRLDTFRTERDQGMRCGAFLFSFHCSMHSISVIERPLDALDRIGFAYSVTGSVALQLHATARGMALDGPLPHDLDLIVAREVRFPAELGRFLCVHSHPNAVNGKMLLQLVDPDVRLRIDIFTAQGSTLQRVTEVPFA